MARNRNIVVRKDPNSWAVTFGDMMSLLLTFFVLIVSFSSLQEAKFEQAAASLKEAFGVMIRPPSAVAVNQPAVPAPVVRAPSPEFLAEVHGIRDQVRAGHLQRQVELELREQGVLFRLDAPFLFASGAAELRPDAQPILDRLVRMFRKFPAEVWIEGHTDAVPIHSARFASNWELSAARAVAVARYFQAQGLPARRLAATGYGEYRPVADNSSEAGRARNRRVEILLRWRGDDAPYGGGWPRAETTGAALEGRGIVDPVTSRLGRVVGSDGQ